jgi:hypothetical protein
MGTVTTVLTFFRDEEGGRKKKNSRSIQCFCKALFVFCAQVECLLENDRCPVFDLSPRMMDVFLGRKPQQFAVFSPSLSRKGTLYSVFLL